MNQSATNDALIGIIGIASIPFIIAFIIFVIWLWFGIGTLTRLTDIKYKLDELIDLLKDKEYSDNQSDSIVLDDEEAAEPVPYKNKPNKIETEIKELKKPSKAFAWTLGTIVGAFAILMAAILYLNR